MAAGFIDQMEAAYNDQLAREAAKELVASLGTSPQGDAKPSQNTKKGKKKKGKSGPAHESIDNNSDDEVAVPQKTSQASVQSDQLKDANKSQQLPTAVTAVNPSSPIELQQIDSTPDPVVPVEPLLQQRSAAAPPGFRGTTSVADPAPAQTSTSDAVSCPLLALVSQ